MYTLDYFKTHPLRVAASRRHLTIVQVLAAEKAKIHPEDIHPVAGAYIHYGGVQLADTLSILKPTLSEDQLATLCKAWYASCGVVCTQLLFYVWQIITKEMVHGSAAKCETAFSGWEKASAPYMKPAMDLCTLISSEKGNYKEKLANFGTDINAACYIDAVERQFRKGGWGGAYGGPKWADIALELQRYMDGDASAMIAADRCWTLVHNTGPIFNKGFYFEYPNTTDLMTVLAAQASSSVFDLGSPGEFLTKYQHDTSEAFCVFANAALKAIQQEQPDYTFASGTAVNADGSKVEGVIGGLTPTHAGAASPGDKKLGPFKIMAATRDPEDA